jgi:hypothetical protein
MDNLSASSQAVLDAAKEAYWLWDEMCPADAKTIAAATVLAIADEVAPAQYELVDDHLWYERVNPLRSKLLEIATELKELK